MGIVIFSDAILAALLKHNKLYRSRTIKTRTKLYWKLEGVNEIDLK